MLFSNLKSAQNLLKKHKYKKCRLTQGCEKIFQSLSHQRETVLFNTNLDYYSPIIPIINSSNFSLRAFFAQCTFNYDFWSFTAVLNPIGLLLCDNPD